MKKSFDTATELKKEMVNSAMSVMTGFYSDIVFDLEKVDELAQRKHDDWFYWVVRQTGTHIRNTNKEYEELKKDLGKSVLVAALIGRSVESGTFEIVYEKQGGQSND